MIPARRLLLPGLLAALAAGILFLRQPLVRAWVRATGSGTERMRARLDDIARTFPKSIGADRFAADIAGRRTRHAASGPFKDEARERMVLGLDLIKIGEPEAATAELELATAAATRDHPDEASLERELALARITAWLRLGEVENCIECCTGSSCLAPIEPEGVHQRPRGSQRCYAELERLLADHPEDHDTRWLRAGGASAAAGGVRLGGGFPARAQRRG